MSGGNKAVELQLQMRQNAEDIMGFMRELECWESDIKKKDEDLRSGLSGEPVRFVSLVFHIIRFYYCFVFVVHPRSLFGRSSCRISRLYAIRTLK